MTTSEELKTQGKPWRKAFIDEVIEELDEIHGNEAVDDPEVFYDLYTYVRDIASAYALDEDLDRTKVDEFFDKVDEFYDDQIAAIEALDEFLANGGLRGVAPTSSQEVFEARDAFRDIWMSSTIRCWPPESLNDWV